MPSSTCGLKDKSCRILDQQCILSKVFMDKKSSQKNISFCKMSPSPRTDLIKKFLLQNVDESHASISDLVLKG